VKIKYKDTAVSSKKSFGQNFLVDPNISRKIVHSAKIAEDDNVIEIGPGFGSLTKVISEVMPRFTCVELDHKLADFISREFPNVNLISNDVLKVDLAKLAEKKPLTVLGNIPYAITSPILFKLIENRAHIDRAVLMMQDEVARRLTAEPKTKQYGILAVQLQAFGQPEYLFKVPKTVFKPRPEVESAVVRIDFSKPVQIEHPAEFQTFVRTAFRMRRKTLANNLKGKYDTSTLTSEVLKKRAEAFSVTEFVALFEQVTAL